MNHTLTSVPGLSVGHWTDLDAITGCTVVLCPAGAVAGVDVRGGSPGTRETDLLNPACTIDRIHAIMLSGGSAFGLSSADGAVRWLEERGIGVDVGLARVPIVPTAILFDLAIGRADVRPGVEAGYAACAAAGIAPVAQGCVGAGTGATVGKALGPGRAMKGGLGSSARRLSEDVWVGALTAVNAFGNVYDLDGRPLAGARDPLTGAISDAVGVMREITWQTVNDPARAAIRNTTLAVVATNARLTKSEAQRVAMMAHDGLARTIRPLHTPLDGDVVFALSTGELRAGLGLIGAVAAEVLAEAVVNAVRAATPLGGLPAAATMRGDDQPPLRETRP